jgi:hypothetical protein
LEQAQALLLPVLLLRLSPQTLLMPDLLPMRRRIKPRTQEP